MSARLTGIVVGTVIGLALATQAAIGQVIVCWTSCAESSAVATYDVATGARLGILSFTSPVYGVAGGQNGTVYVHLGNKIKAVNVSTGATTASYDVPWGLKTQYWNMAYGQDACLYYTDNLNRFVRVDTTTGQVTTITPSARLIDPTDIAIGPDGDIYTCVGTLNGWGVSRYRAATGIYVESYYETRDLATPRHLAFSADGDLYALNQCADGIYKLDRASGLFNEIVPPAMPGWGFSEMARDVDGSILVIGFNSHDNMDKLGRYDSVTNSVTYLRRAFKQPFAVAAVPEPAGIGVLFLGMVGLPVFARLRRRGSAVPSQRTGS